MQPTHHRKEDRTAACANEQCRLTAFSAPQNVYIQFTDPSEMNLYEIFSPDGTIDPRDLESDGRVTNNLHDHIPMLRVSPARESGRSSPLPDGPATHFDLMEEKEAEAEADAAAAAEAAAEALMELFAGSAQGTSTGQGTRAPRGAEEGRILAHRDRSPTATVDCSRLNTPSPPLHN